MNYEYCIHFNYNQLQTVFSTLKTIRNLGFELFCISYEF